ncbi:MAG: hypothetical protein E7358_01955 [Clostridiales bacterium]|nr:hypothetical protein [Clostridiales bacterium]
MIYLLADMHGGEKLGELNKYLEIANDDDLLIILGDIGIKFCDSEENKAFDDLIFSSKKKIAFLDGNHENFKYIYSFNEEKWCGGIIHRLTENVIHLKRGYVFEIQGKSFFVFGGCKSSPKWKEQGLYQPEEEPTEKQLDRAYNNLKKYGYKVDYVLTHKYENGKGTVNEDLFNLCKFIDDKVEYKHFYAGHWHNAKVFDEKHTFVYDKLVCIE